MNPIQPDMSQDVLPVEFDLVLLSNFVHQVVNPLNGVAGTLDNLIDGTIQEESRRDQRMRAVRAQVEQCITLMRNLAFLSRGFERITAEDRRFTVIPQAIIESAMFFQEDGKRKGVEIKLIEKADQNKVLGHPELLRQVFMNLFDNAVKYSRRDSVVVVHQRIQKHTGAVLISISSKSQIPLANMELSSIFNLGFRGGNAKQIIASGTGLGLYICREIIEKVHGGSLTVQTAPDNGLEFIIKLPSGEAS